MNEIGSALVLSAITASLLFVFLWLAEARVRWKVLALAAFAVPLVLFTGSPALFAAGIAIQTLLGISLAVYFKVAL